MVNDVGEVGVFRRMYRVFCRECRVTRYQIVFWNQWNKFDLSEMPGSVRRREVTGRRKLLWLAVAPETMTPLPSGSSHSVRQGRCRRLVVSAEDLYLHPTVLAAGKLSYSLIDWLFRTQPFRIDPVSSSIVLNR